MSLRCGLIGCGGMGRELATALKDRVADAEVVAAVDPYAPNLEKLCADLGAAPAGSLEEMLARDDIGAVIVASPNDLHCGQVLLAARARKHVFCEKPMALSTADCDRMIDACGEAGVKLMVGHSMRFYPLPRRLLELAAGGELGTPRYGFASYFFSGFKERQSEVWHINRDRSGGLFFHMAIHHIDLFLAIFGPARRVTYAGGRYGTQVRDFDDVGSVMIEFESGATGVLSASSLSPVPWREMAFLFSGGFARLDSPWSYLEFGADENHLSRLEPDDIGGPQAIETELASFVRWALHEEAPLLTGEEGRAAVAVAESAQRAKETGAAVELGG